jgi:DNA-binding response OmpR family regulator
MSLIIVADDDPVFSGLIVHTLEKAGHVVGGVSDGPSALKAISLKLPDVAILDINMPGCSGVEVVRQLRMSSHAQHVPLIMLTTRASEKDAEIAVRAGADDYLRKPLDPDLLLACVERQLGGRRRCY